MIAYISFTYKYSKLINFIVKLAELLKFLKKNLLIWVGKNLLDNTIKCSLFYCNRRIVLVRTSRKLIWLSGFVRHLPPDKFILLS